MLVLADLGRHHISIQPRKNDITCRRMTSDCLFQDRRLKMFWTVVLVGFASAVLIKLGALSVTASILSLALKVCLAVILLFLALGIWIWMRRS